MSARAVRLSALLDASEIRPIATHGPDPDVSGATLDSRSVEPGHVFFAIRGMESDGERFIPDAVARGARAVVAASPPPSSADPGVAWIQVADPRSAAGLIAREYHGRPDENLTLVGITGTNGKTTVAHLVESIGRAAGRTVGRIGTIGCAFDGVERPSGRTTPEAPDFFRLLSEMHGAGVDLVAMEVSSHALTLQRVAGARFRAAVFLNLSREHLDFHGDEQRYFEAKARLFDGLDRESRAILPVDTEYGRRLAERTDAPVLGFGRSAAADVRLTEEHCSLDGSSAVLETPSGRLPIRTFLLGGYNLDNVSAAAACALALRLPPETIPVGVLALESVPGRMEIVDRGQPFTVIVDYAHTEAALERLLSWTAGVCRGRLHVVFGCGGERDQGKRQAMGAVAAKIADHVWLTSDNPRREEPGRILAQIARGVESVPGGRDRCRIEQDRERAIGEALAEAEDGDVVIVAGKGHEDRQQIGETSLPFDDRDVVRRALRCLGWDGVGRANA